MQAPVENSWNRRLLELLEYRVVLGAVVTTIDGLVVAHAGVRVEDAEVLAAAVSRKHGQVAAPGGGIIRVVHGRDLSLIVLLEPDAPQDRLAAVLAAYLATLEDDLAA